jgi:hypothetical protein
VNASKTDFGKSQLIELAVVLIITTVAYSPILFNFFLGDDFVHLSWLSKCIKDPSMLLFNFNHSWLDVITTKFYRPLISVFMFTDYAVWRTNGFGFHLTNLLFHLANCCLVFGITNTLDGVMSQRESENNGEGEGEGTSEDLVNGQAANEKVRKRKLNILRWPFLSSLLFGLYPLHPEAVSWITGRVDAIVTTFYLSALYSYMRWSTKQKPLYLVLSIFSNVCALLSKEMAVTIPVAICAWELYYRSPKKLTLKISLLPVSIFWIMLALYFVVRRIALGTFIGGYDNSLLFVAHTNAVVTQWLHAIRMTLIPINKNVISDRNILTLGWISGMLTASGAAIYVLMKPRFRETLFLLSALFAISLVPIYKIFAIADNLESSRLIYLPSAFLCMMITLGLSQLFTTKKQLQTRVIIAFSTLTSIFLSCAFGLLWRNNQVWRDAGLECTAIRKSIENVSRNQPANTHFLFVGLPDQINGAYICRNASPGIVEVPQSARTLTDCIFLNSYDPVFPFGFLKKSLQECRSSVQLWNWSRELQALCKVSLPSPEKVKDAELMTASIAQPMRFNANKVPCWNTDFVLMTPSAESKMEKAPKFTFANDICTNRNPDSQLSFFDFKMPRQAGELIPLRSKALWAFGESGELFHRAPAQNHKPRRNADEPTFEIVSAKKIMPTIDFNNSGYLGSKGFLHLSSNNPYEKITCNANEVPNVDHFSLEILKPNQFLNPSEQNGVGPTVQALKEIKSDGKQEFIVIQKSDLEGQGLYQARLWCMDKDGQRIGVAGDHIIISIDP